MLVASHIRTANGWVAQEALSQLDETLHVPHLDFSLALAQLYVPLLEDDLIKPFTPPPLRSVKQGLPVQTIGFE